MQTIQNRLSGGLLTILGVLAFGTGIYFLGIRPTLLPEDIRFTGIDEATLPQPFLDWLGIVFRTWGGFITGFAIVITGIGVATFSGDAKWLRYGTAAGILVAFGRFAYSNVVISGDYLIFIASMFIVALIAAGLLLWKPGP
ncbi:hypothetical protein GRZ55_03565 [Chelativorans sp. ZYF759]|uniref:hypothetical protein n=1 Tax=Chelativorans sp. ZYF759 TaxID=2692213 RepID=UPI00145E0FC6|nr:hypothetical protein [Chelativorans sp. ZYF759]NMG38317.1 hypothetical protein [Chelativorans sp. ZYF759]